MNRFLTIFVFVFSIFFQAVPAFALFDFSRCIMIDIDETLVFQAPPQLNGVGHASLQAFAQSGNLVILPGETYVLFPGAREFLRSMVGLDQFRVVFYSLGQVTRNLPLIQNILAGTFLTSDFAYIQSRKHFQIYSREEAILDGGKKRYERAGCDPTKSILIDDNPSIIFPGQESSFLGVAGNFDVKSYLEDSFKISLPQETHYALNHWYYVRAQLDVILQNQDSKAASQTLHELQFDPSLGRYNYAPLWQDVKKVETGKRLLAMPRG